MNFVENGSTDSCDSLIFKYLVLAILSLNKSNESNPRILWGLPCPKQAIVRASRDKHEAAVPEGQPTPCPRLRVGAGGAKNVILKASVRSVFLMTVESIPWQVSWEGCG